MVIKKLIIKSFGKFQDKEIEFTKGLNLLYGDNEAGKSTVHRFIEGMFYGFYKPYVKNKKYTEDYDRYLPWNNSNMYQGILIYEYDGREYRIERNFMKRSDNVEVYDNITGENITAEFEYDTVTKLYQPASKHLDLNKSIFNNTISIAQLNNKTGEELVKEVKDRIINLSGTQDEDISVKNVLDKLEKKLKDIGTVKAKKSIYGNLIVNIETLIEEKAQAGQVWDEIKDYQENLNNTYQFLEKLEALEKENENLINFIKAEEYKKRYKEAKEVGEAIKSTIKQLEELVRYKEANINEIDQTIKKITNRGMLLNNISELESEKKELEKTLENLTKEINRLNAFQDERSKELEGIIGDYSIYKQLLDDLKAIESEILTLTDKVNIKSNGLEGLEKDFYEYEDLEDKVIQYRISESNDLEKNKSNHTEELNKNKLYKNAIGISGLTLILMIGLIFISNFSILPIIIGIAAIITIVLSSVKYNNQKIKIQAKLNIISELEQKELEYRKKLESIYERQNEILTRYKCNSKGELRALKDKQIHIITMYTENKERLNQLIINKDRLNSKLNELGSKLKYWLGKITQTDLINDENIKNLKDHYNSYKDFCIKINSNKDKLQGISIKVSSINYDLQVLNKDIDYICNEYDAKTEKELENVKENYYKYLELEQDIKYKKELLCRILKEDTIQGLKEKIKESDNPPELDNITEEEILQRQENNRQQILDTNKKISTIETKIKQLQLGVRPLVEIEEEISEKNELKSQLDNKIKALEMAKEAIEVISKDIQNNFAPELNKNVSNMINKVTDGKYSEIKINPDMDILTYDPNSNKLVSIDQLSSGTIDLMYFGLRTGIIKVIKGKDQLPLILDDCFMQYDIERLKRIIALLADQDKQVIMFTCHEREYDLLEEQGSKFNYIKI